MRGKDDKRFKDLLMVADSDHTRGNKSFNSKLNTKYCTKQNWYSWDSMHWRIELAAISHNENVDQEFAYNQDGTIILR